MATRKEAQRPKRKLRPAMRGIRRPDADYRRPIAASSKDASEAWAAPDDDPASEDESVEPGESWPDEEDLLDDKD